MKKTLLICSLVALISCDQQLKEYTGPKYVVQTTVQIKDGTTSEVLALFKSTNPELVKNEEDWIRASFASDEDKNMVTVRAVWKSKESYLSFANSDKFKNTMASFSTYFESRPEVSISEILFEM